MKGLLRTQTILLAAFWFSLVMVSLASRPLFPVDETRYAAVAWEMLTGPQGTVAIAGRLVTDIPAFSYTSYYSDRLSPVDTQCTGDDYEYAASGPWVDHAIPNTDPALGAYYRFELTRTIAYGPPGESTAFAEALSAEVDDPVVVEAFVAAVEAGDCGASTPGEGHQFVAACAPDTGDRAALRQPDAVVPLDDILHEAE